MILKNREVINTVRTRIIELVNRNRSGSWVGTMTDLMDALTRRNRPTVFPNSPSALRLVVNKAISSLRREGYVAKFTRTTDHSRRRVVSFKRRDQPQAVEQTATTKDSGSRKAR